MATVNIGSCQCNEDTSCASSSDTSLGVDNCVTASPSTSEAENPAPAPVPPTPTPPAPGSCPSNFPCVGASDCTPHNLPHCVDGCCANIGSKSAKSTKSAKTKSTTTKSAKLG